MDRCKPCQHRPHVVNGVSGAKPSFGRPCLSSQSSLWQRYSHAHSHQDEANDCFSSRSSNNLQFVSEGIHSSCGAPSWFRTGVRCDRHVPLCYPTVSRGVSCHRDLQAHVACAAVHRELENMRTLLHERSCWLSK